MKQPPPKKPGQARGRRVINGALLDVSAASAFLGVTDKTLRARVSRRQVPFRRWHKRIVFNRRELERFIEKGLDGGCSLDEALQNLEARDGR